MVLRGRASGTGGPDGLTVVLVAVLGLALIAGYVVLAALERDTTGYLLFLGGPAITGLVGAILGRRVGTVGEAVTDAAAETKAVVQQSASALSDQLADQSTTLAAAAADARTARIAVAGPNSALPPARSAPGRSAPVPAPVSAPTTEH